MLRGAAPTPEVEQTHRSELCKDPAIGDPTYLGIVVPCRLNLPTSISLLAAYQVQASEELCCNLQKLRC